MKIIIEELTPRQLDDSVKMFNNVIKTDRIEVEMVEMGGKVWLLEAGSESGWHIATIQLENSPFTRYRLDISVGREQVKVAEFIYMLSKQK